jgi:hypothetical protein
MQGKAEERWIELCEQAAVEHDANKLLKLIQEIDKLLREKQERMHSAKDSRTRRPLNCLADRGLRQSTGFS